MFSPQEWLAAAYPFGLSFHCRIRNTPEREARDGSADSVDLKRVIRGFRPVDVAIATSLTSAIRSCRVFLDAEHYGQGRISAQKRESCSASSGPDDEASHRGSRNSSQAHHADFASYGRKKQFIPQCVDLGRKVALGIGHSRRFHSRGRRCHAENYEANQDETEGLVVHLLFSFLRWV
ncbi:MAG: hypothetical protein OXG81_12000 [Acidobacteria bacterium]|nr:hypothetical protein [Acidobacteriota bacterium]